MNTYVCEINGGFIFTLIIALKLLVSVEMEGSVVGLIITLQ